ncbi:hypothetical protein FHE72_20445 [Rossellomorea vietnamensis]|uniref:Uncharacterized protein n=1 Tax=Rossellomorea vietnamensis TaxID=218284 RepID=A0A6I6UU43_9BACI|nr:hypothetical protein [Rossellomorea vietnamensis]QHE63111.1 hypothetical protein FHE72_20445 [Rossellomorea vietnamensis]
MSKEYKMIYHFNDGESWGGETQTVSLTAEQVTFMLNHFQSSNNLEVESKQTGEVRKVKDIKSIELIF